uniref:Uncharacterized protein n=1 Tax=Clytia hemisphaerica TaxID=252671 RepID=A0A7M5XAL4_9CNID|eukprot:TCONS_00067043-protein
MDDKELKFEYSVVKYQYQCARNDLWKQKNTLKRLKMVEEIRKESTSNNNFVGSYDLAKDEAQRKALNQELVTLQQRLRNLNSELKGFVRQRDAIQEQNFKMEDQIDRILSDRALKSRSKSVPSFKKSLSEPNVFKASSLGTSPTNLGVPQPRARLGSAVVANRKMQLPSIKTTIKLKMNLMALRKKAQMKIEARKNGEDGKNDFMPFPNLATRGSSRLNPRRGSFKN